MFLFVYVGLTAVVDRWGSTYDEYAELRQKQDDLLDPSAVMERMAVMTSRRDSLEMRLTDDSGEYEQSQSGVLEFLTAKAKVTTVRIESLVPVEGKSEGQLENVGFRISFSAGFHDAGFFLNALENSGMSVSITKFGLTASSPSSSILHGEIEGSVYIFPMRSSG